MSVLKEETDLFQQLEHQLGSLVGLGQHGLRGLLDDVALGEFGRCHGLIRIFDAAA